jgi:hypothetical protein
VWWDTCKFRPAARSRMTALENPMHPVVRQKRRAAGGEANFALPVYR